MTSRQFLVVLTLVTGIFFESVAQAQPPSGRKLAFLVGVKNYDHDQLGDLQFPENDVTDLADVLKANGFEVRLFTSVLGKSNAALPPKAANLRRELKKFVTGATKHDLIMVGLAGHGLQLTGSDESYFCPQDANPSVQGGKFIAPETLLGMNEILTVLSQSGVGQKLLLVDACRNDPTVRGRGLSDVHMDALPSRTAVLLSCKSGQFAFENKDLGRGHGVFFHHVIEGLRNGAKDEDGLITWQDLATYVQKRVPRTVTEITKNDGAEQNPNLIANLESTPLLARVSITPVKPLRPGPSVPPPVKPANSFAGKTAGELKVLNGVNFRWCPAGSFTMGSPASESDRRDDEAQVTVELSRGFWLQETEVTQGQFAKLMGKSPWSGESYVKEGDDYAASYVSHDDAVSYCAQRTEQERKGGRLPGDWQYALPTEAQWEYACRAGTETAYSFGESASLLGEYGWNYANAWNVGEKYAHRVGLKKANAWGLKDMHGNVWEWCGDWDWKELKGGRDPRGPSSGSDRVYRGGACNIEACSRSASRGHNAPDSRFYYVGYRLAVVPSP